MKFVTLLVKSLRIISETLLDFQNKQNQQQCQNEKAKSEEYKLVSDIIQKFSKLLIYTGG
jgi:hypothetical protein